VDGAGYTGVGWLVSMVQRFVHFDEADYMTKDSGNRIVEFFKNLADV